MRVLVTGGTGFIGAHTVAALRRDGHVVRVLVRDKARLDASLRPVGVSPDEVEAARGDMTRPDTIPPALAGVDALVHAASVYSYDPRDAARIAEVNLAGTQTLLDAATTAGVDPVVHVSSTVALLPATTAVLDADSPVGAPDEAIAPYCASKAAQEREVRRRQAEGAPIVSVLPGAVWGPNDPYDGESTRLARSIARRHLLVSVRGGFPCVDVRDVADVLAAVVRAGPGLGPRRYLAGGEWHTLGDLHRLVGAALGRRLVTFASPAPAAMLLARGARWVQGRVRPRLPIGVEPVFVTSAFAPTDDSGTVEELGVTFRPFRQTVRDQLAWQQAADRL